MPKQYTREEYQKLYKTLPDEIKEAAFSPEVSDQIDQIVERNGLDLLVAGKVSHYVGDVLFGVLPPAEFAQTLQKEVGIQKAPAEKIAQEINQFIFRPIRPHLERLYQHEKPAQSEETPTAKVKVSPARKQEAQDATEQKSKQPTPPSGNDPYREQVENE
ncbi:MAG: hypothetical protein Q8P39_02440 [Candidatus Yanofskybacteria bacterium]|nr:hypothetical protein [Candidatus Yanofskybacteria bacterium]